MMKQAPNDNDEDDKSKRKFPKPQHLGHFGLKFKKNNQQKRACSRDPRQSFYPKYKCKACEICSGIVQVLGRCGTHHEAIKVTTRVSRCKESNSNR